MYRGLPSYSLFCSTLPWSTGVNQGGFIKFTVIITTNQLHFHFRNDIPFLNKEVSKMVLGEKFC